MSFATVNQLQLAYDVQGTGTPLLLLAGLSGTRAGWHADLSWLTPHHTVITLDNRGSGESDAPPPPYTMADIASDVVGLLDELALPAAHVCGFSFGGMIAQHVALLYPTRVLSLVLGATTCGGAMHRMAAAEVMATLDPAYGVGRSPEEVARTAAELNLSPTYRAAHPEAVSAFMAGLLAQPQTPAGYAGQLAARADHDTYDRLPLISHPTLVLHGTADRLIPVANAHLLATRIRGAELIELPDVGHCPTLEAPHCWQQIVDFCAAASAPLEPINSQTHLT